MTSERSCGWSWSSTSRALTRRCSSGQSRSCPPRTSPDCSTSAPPPAWPGRSRAPRQQEFSLRRLCLLLVVIVLGGCVQQRNLTRDDLTRRCLLLTTNDSEAHIDGARLGAPPEVRYRGTLIASPGRSAGSSRRALEACCWSPPATSCKAGIWCARIATVKRPRARRGDCMIALAMTSACSATTSLTPAPPCSVTFVVAVQLSDRHQQPGPEQPDLNNKASGSIGG